VTDGTQNLAQSGVSTSDVADRNLELLLGYQQTLEALDGLGWVIGVPPSRSFKWFQVPRFRWLVSLFLVQHINRNLASLKRCYLARSALALDHEDPAEVRAIERFERSLPILRSRLLILVVLFVVFLVALGLASLVAQSDDDAAPLAAATKAIVTLSPDEFVTALESFDTPGSFVMAGLGLIASLYLVLVVPMSSFGLKRMLLNLYPDMSREQVKAAFSGRHTFRRGGLYQRETQVFRAAGVRQPDELRLDLVLEAVVTFFALFLGVFFAVGLFEGVAGGEHKSGVAVAGGLLSSNLELSFPAALLLSVSLLRLGHLGIMWRHHRREESGALIEVAAPAAESVGALPHARWARRALATGVDLLLLSVLWVAYFVVWVAATASVPDESGGFAALGLFLVTPTLAMGTYAFLLVRRGKRNGQTVGKRLLGVRVVQTDGRRITTGRALLREVVGKEFVFGLLSLMLLGIPLLLNYLWPLWDDEKRALHDRLAGTFVARN
jgi:uncharacterized RDD family membrane protein YckC